MKKLVFILLVSITLISGPGLAQNKPTRTITHITGDLYRFQNNFHFSVFLVTSEGIIVTDPIDKDAATWLKAELKKRFDKPIKYLIYSHDHRDPVRCSQMKPS
jgi:flavorubredoxin